MWEKLAAGVCKALPFCSASAVFRGHGTAFRLCFRGRSQTMPFLRSCQSAGHLRQCLSLRCVRYQVAGTDATIAVQLEIGDWHDGRVHGKYGRVHDDRAGPTRPTDTMRAQLRNSSAALARARAAVGGTVILMAPSFCFYIPVEAPDKGGWDAAE